MGFNTFPCNPYPISTEELNKGNNDDLNTRVAALESDVSDLNSTKANQITIAPFFNAETAYTAGDLVYYNGLTYRCTNDHEGEWDADDFAATTISNELDTLKSGLTKHPITFTANTGYTIEDKGSYVIGDVAFLNFFIKSASQITSGRVNVGDMSIELQSGKVVAVTCPTAQDIDGFLNGVTNVLLGASSKSTITVGDYVTQQSGFAQVCVNCTIIIS